MLGKILLILLLAILLIVMSSIMIIFERDKPRAIILWLTLFIFTSLIGGAIYLCSKIIYYKKRNSLSVKVKEDQVFEKLVSKQLLKTDENLADDYFSFNKLGYNAQVYGNNSVEFFHSHIKFKENLLREINTAKKYIIFEVTKLDVNDFEWLEQPLLKKLEAGVIVKIIYDKHVSRKAKQELIKAGAKVYKFSKLRTFDRTLINKRNRIIIDGTTAYLGKIDAKKCQLKNKCTVANVLLKFKGDVVQAVDISAHKDVIFASGKYMEYTAPKFEAKADATMQYIPNAVNQDLELMLIKAICMAKESIQIQVEEFIPTESIMSLLKFALNSNIDVRLMVPLKSENSSRYYASRAYVKELALSGANCYLYDGFIRFNAMVIDSKYAMYGSFTLNRGLINQTLQDVMIIEDEKTIGHFNKIFSMSVDNSYRINDAKLLLLREKFFKNFV